MKKVLHTPLIPTKTLNTTAAFSIVINNIPSAYDWECLNCVKLRIDEPDPLDFSAKLQISQKSETPFINKEWKTGKDYYNIIQNNKKIIDFLENEINCDKYVYFFFEQYNVPGMKPYNRYKYQHDCILYGYDNTQRVFYVLAYTANQKFESINIDYDVLTKAIIDNKSSRQYFLSCSPKFEEFKISINDIYRYLSTYIGLSNNADQSISINIGIYETLAEQIMMSWKFYIDFRTYRLLYEHMVCIQYLAKRLQELLPIENFEKELLIASKCVSQADVLFKVLMKYCMTKNVDIKWRAIDILRNLHNTEYFLIESLCNKLINHMV